MSTSHIKNNMHTNFTNEIVGEYTKINKPHQESITLEDAVWAGVILVGSLLIVMLLLTL